MRSVLYSRLHVTLDVTHRLFNHVLSYLPCYGAPLTSAVLYFKCSNDITAVFSSIINKKERKWYLKKNSVGLHFEPFFQAWYCNR